MRLSRRQFVQTALSGGALLATTQLGAFAEGRKAPGWVAGFTTAPKEGFAPRVLERVNGRAPDGLTGTLYRNGPAQFRYGDQTASHWFDGDGMIQRIRFEAGKAVHAGQFVQTPKRKAEQEAGRFLAPGFGTAGDPDYPVMSPDDVNAANTSVMMSNGRLHALWEAGSAFELEPDTLQTVGPRTWRDDLAGMPFLAHPKVEPGGRIWNLGVQGPHVAIYRISARGDLEDFGLVNMGVAAYVHDWAMTERHLVILVQPWIYQQSLPPFVDGLAWRPEDGLKALVIDKDTLETVWTAQAPARAFFHTGSAWESEDGAIRIDGAFYASPVLGSGGGANLIRGEYSEGDEMISSYSRLVLRPGQDGAFEEYGLEGEFPQVHPAFSGRSRRYSAITTGSAPGRPMATTLAMVDLETGAVDSHDFGVHHLVEEFLFVAKPDGRDERDAWLVGPTLNARDGVTEIHVLDARRVSDGPVVSWRAPYAWPLGFHGCFHAV